MHDIVVIPSVGLPKHAVKVASWGADAVMIQGGEGGGHTGSVPTTLLLPTVLDAVDIPVIAAGGFFDGRGLAAALSYGAAGVGMGTRFLLTADSRVPDAVKQRYLAASLDDTVVTKKVDGMPHRMLRTDLVDQVEGGSGLRRLIPTARRTLEFKRMAGMTWKQLAVDGRAMRKEQGRTLGQLALAANTPMMLKAGLVDGDATAGVLASGQVVGVIDDLPTCEELIDRVVTERRGSPQARQRLPGLRSRPHQMSATFVRETVASAYTTAGIRSAGCGDLHEDLLGEIGATDDEVGQVGMGRVVGQRRAIDP